MDELRKLQNAELEILCVIDEFCKSNQIEYSLYAGTLLGAVRHKGFIPWDDDLDICMTREYYIRFLKCWEASPPEGFILQNKDNSPSFTQSFSKIRKDHTTFLQYDWERGKYHTGIFVDVFPIDRMPKGKIARMLFQWDCMRYLLLTREFIPQKEKLIVKLISRLFLWISPKKYRKAVRTRLLKQITRENNPDANMVAIETLKTSRTILPPHMMDSFIAIPFETRSFSCIANWEEYLRIKYDDYMTMPPESERSWTHHPIILDFEHNLEELPNE